MSLQRNILAGFVSQIYVALIGIAIVPLYVKYMGVEAYGLVGFFAMLQAWFTVLDMGLTPTISRETARYRGGNTDPLIFRKLLRALELVFFLVALLGALAIGLGSEYIAQEWLKVHALSIWEVQYAVQLMGVGIALRWMAGLYRGTVIGFEKLVWLGYFNIAVATLRFVGALPVLIFLDSSPTYFFGYQLIVAAFETSVLLLCTYRLIPRVPKGSMRLWDFAPIKGVLGFSVTIAFTSCIWVTVTQTDKLLLSKILPLTEYGYFALAVVLASGISIVAGPIGTSLLPRMTRLNAEGDHQGLIRIYRSGTQLAAVVVLPASLMLAVFSEQVLWAWTGSSEIAAQSAPILGLYAFGNGALALAAFPYYLQFAKGDLRLHLYGNLLFASIFLPTLFWATFNFGATGAGAAWVFSNLIPLMFWAPVVHRKFLVGLHREWVVKDILPIAVGSLLATYGAHSFLDWPENRIVVSLMLVSVYAFILFGATLCSSSLRDQVRVHAKSLLKGLFL